MAAVKVHGSPFSTATMRVTACLFEKQLEFEFVSVNLGEREHKKEPFISLNPFGQVPAFEDGDLQLFESRAITQYIVQEYAEKGTQLISRESKEMAIIWVWLEVESQQYDTPASKLVWELAIKPMYGMSSDTVVIDTVVIEESEAKLGTVLDIYEKRLSEFKYLAGDCFSLVDLHHLPTIQYLMNSQTRKLFESRPRVHAWVADITARPGQRSLLCKTRIRK